MSPVPRRLLKLPFDPQNNRLPTNKCVNFDHHSHTSLKHCLLLQARVRADICHCYLASEPPAPSSFGSSRPLFPLIESTGVNSSRQGRGVGVDRLMSEVKVRVPTFGSRVKNPAVRRSWRRAPVFVCEEQREKLTHNNHQVYGINQYFSTELFYRWVQY